MCHEKVAPSSNDGLSIVGLAIVNDDKSLALIFRVEYFSEFRLKRAELVWSPDSDSFESKLMFLFFVMSIKSKSILNEILLSLLFLSIFFKLIAYATIDLLQYLWQTRVQILMAL